MRIVRTSDRRTLERLFARDRAHDREVALKAARIVADVRRQGDRALTRWMRELDDVRPPFEITRRAMDEGWRRTSTEVRRAIRKAARAVRGYRRELGIEFPTLVAGLSETDEASKALPMLNGVYGFPTAILVDRSGVVRSIHTGFAGPATGRHHEEYVREFRDEVEQLLAGDAHYR